MSCQGCQKTDCSLTMCNCQPPHHFCKGCFKANRPYCSLIKDFCSETGTKSHVGGSWDHGVCRCGKTVCLTCFNREEYEDKYNMQCPYCNQTDGVVMCITTNVINSKYTFPTRTYTRAFELAKAAEQEAAKPDAKRVKLEPGAGGAGH